MEYAELKESIKSLELETVRVESRNYFEAVMSNEHQATLNTSLKKFFGNPIWPSENNLSFLVQETINSFGGIMANQTLYFKGRGEDVVFAMLWPWQDGKYITVKIVKKS
jgi:hypothetical protein